MPNSLVLLSINADKVNMELRLPVQEFELAFNENLSDSCEDIVEKYNIELRNYILNHLKVYSVNHDVGWSISIDKLQEDIVKKEIINNVIE